MTVYRITTIYKYIGLSTDAKPTGVPPGSEFVAYDTKRSYVCYDGTNWTTDDLVGNSPSMSPSVSPSNSPSNSPSESPSKSPSASPSNSPSNSPSASPST